MSTTPAWYRKALVQIWILVFLGLSILVLCGWPFMLLLLVVIADIIVLSTGHIYIKSGDNWDISIYWRVSELLCAVGILLLAVFRIGGLL